MSDRHQVERLIHELKFGFEGDETGENRFQPAIWWLLRDVDMRRALYRPIPEAHNIWELTLHVIAWKRYVAARFRGEQPQVTAEMDWPAIGDASEQAWEATKAELLRVQSELVEAASAVTDDQLDSPALNGPIPRYAIYHGITQHDQYHGGQIAILKKAKL